MASPRPHLRWRRAGLRLLFSLLLLALLFATLRADDLAGALSSFWQRSKGAWGLALIAFLVLHATAAMKWRLFLRLAGARISPGEALRFYGAGLFANLCLPSLIGGDVLRAGLAMGRCEKKEAVLLGSVVDRAADLMSLGLLVAGGAALAPSALATMESASIRGSTILLGFFVPAIVGGTAFVIALRRIPLKRWPRKVARRLPELLRASRTMRAAPWGSAGAVVLCVVLQAGFVAINAYLGRVMGFHMDWRLWFLLWPLAKIAAMLPISLGGIGVREAAFAALVRPFSESTTLAVAQSLVWQTVMIAGGVLAGAAWLVTGRSRMEAGIHAAPAGLVAAKPEE